MVQTLATGYNDWTFVINTVNLLSVDQLSCYNTTMQFYDHGWPQQVSKSNPVGHFDKGYVVTKIVDSWIHPSVRPSIHSSILVSSIGSLTLQGIPVVSNISQLMLGDSHGQMTDPIPPVNSGFTLGVLPVWPALKTSKKRCPGCIRMIWR